MRERVSLFVALLVVVASTLGFWWTRFSPAGPDTVAVSDAKEIFRHPFTGVVSEVPVVPPLVAAVMIDHAGDAGSPTGVEEAFYVIEAPVEGNITRWLAFFDLSRDVLEIGPVRSARPYFVELARQGWFVLFAHVGGSPEALDLLSLADDIQDLNEYSHASNYWRAKQRAAPHNVFASTARLARAAQQRREGVSVPTWTFRDVELNASASKACYLVTFGGGNGYDVKWCYRSETNDFVRSMNGILEKTKSGKILAASNIIIMQTRVETIDSLGRKRIVTTGSGQAILLQDGFAT